MSNHSAVTLGLAIAVIVLAALIWRLNGQISDLEGGNSLGVYDRSSPTYASDVIQNSRRLSAPGRLDAVERQLERLSR